MKKTTNKILTSYKLYSSVAFLTIAVFFNFLSSNYISRYFPNRVVIDDLLFRITPYISWTQYWSDIANLFSGTLLLVYILYGKGKQFPYFLTSIGLVYLMRAVLIILNPLGGPLGNGMHYGLTEIHQYGQFPSGHTAFVFLCYFLVNKTDAPNIKMLLLISIIIEVCSLILSRGHYSIDIVGGFFIAYVAINIMQRYKQRLMI